MQPATLTADLLSSLPEPQRAAILSEFTETERVALQHHWPFWSRPQQLEPPRLTPAGVLWSNWLILAGRGFGKTRTGAEWIRKIKETHGRIALVGETVADVRDVMIEGESGIMACSPDWDRPRHIASLREVRWDNGAIAKTYSGEEPDQLRGPQHEAAWVDELAKFQYAQDSWDQLQFGLRLGTWPRTLITTTPRPIPVLKSIMKDTATVIVRGSTYDNAKNLAPSFMKAIRDRYEGTRLGRQELMAEVLDDLAGALWSWDMIECARYKGELPQMSRVVVGVDPSGFDGETGDSQGIVVAGLGKDGYYYIIDDRSVRMKPEGWGRAVITTYRDHKADRIVVEKNYGGDMCRAVIQAVMPAAPVHDVSASRGKHLRAEPIAALYEQGKVRHVRPFPALEEQMTQVTTQAWEGVASPDRLDAMVWAMTELTQGKTVSIIGIF